MTGQEQIVVNKSSELWNEFLKLPVLHHDDQNDFRFHIHAIQNMIMARGEMRLQNFVNTNTPRVNVYVKEDEGTIRTKG